MTREFPQGMDQVEREFRAKEQPKALPWESLPQGPERTLEIMKWVNKLSSWVMGAEDFKGRARPGVTGMGSDRPMDDDQRRELASMLFKKHTGAELPVHVQTMVMESLDELGAVRNMPPEAWEDLDAEFDKWLKDTYRRKPKK